MGYRKRIVDTRLYPLNPDPMRRYFRHYAITMELERTAVLNAEAAITHLLKRVAPLLQHLCYDQALPSLALFRVQLPALEELTCRVEHDWTHEYYDNAAGLYKPISFLLQLPMLKSLHVVLRGMQWCTCVPREVPPSLERVRFSDSTSPSLIVNELTNRRPWLTQDSLFIILVSHDYEDLSYSEYSWPSRPKLARMIESARQDMLHKIHAVKDLKKYNQHRLHTEWLARVQGREGCWKEGTPLTLMKKWHRIPSQS
jgi:hypothetical protein